MKTIINKVKSQKQAGDEEENNLPGYPVYPANEDIYSIYLEEKDIDPETISMPQETDEYYSGITGNEIDFSDNLSDIDLDIPGAELDDAMENIGSEDEENNYYSLGGDDHEDLEEGQGE